MPALKIDEHGYAEFRGYLDIFQRRRIASTLTAAGFRVREGSQHLTNGATNHFVRLLVGEDRRKASRLADKALREMP